ncbi:MAG TPA: glycoside hydrolase family 127 protein [Kiritimatiellia bacterium]|nr:glycoside hydrolase family 127 protein [Kiritimatiellia bacterium]HPS06799.1 glycoside hydrolase family 127 protein [Kiritimatiellia bacterium]
MNKCCFLVLSALAGVSFAALPERTHALKQPAKMEMLRPGEVKPQGWLRDWCVTAKNGYISRMDEVDPAFPRAWNRDFHPRGKYLDWGDPNKGAWCTEGGAYWFEGLVRLAWELDDPELKAYAKERLEPLLERMNPNSIAFVYWMDRNDPAQMDEIERANHGFIVGASGRTTRAVLAYWEATGDERALRALKWCLDDPRFYFFGNPITLPAAACDTWRYCGDGYLAKALDNFFATKPYPERWPAMRYGLPVTPETIRMRERRDGDPNSNWEWRLQHGVLCYESMFSWVKGSLWTGDAKYLANVRSWLDFQERHTRQSHGVTVADEQFGWAGPDRGTETCTVAGDLLLYATLAGVTGEGRFADHVERSFFNAGPACVSRDFMHHAYFQSPNRVAACGKFHAGPGGQGGVFKTKHWPLCCTAALARILPGYVQWMWMKPAEGGLAATLYAPNTLETELKGTSVRIETKTDYPFDETLEMSVETGKPIKFPLKLRVPEWCRTPEFAVNGTPADLCAGTDGFAVLDREWKEGEKVTLKFPMAAKAETMRDFNDGGKPYCSVSYGPLLFAYGLPEKDENTAVEGARTDWKLDSSKAAAAVEVLRAPMPAKWDWPFDAPLKLRTKAADGSSVLELIPYGCAKLRVALFPDVSQTLPPLPKEGLSSISVPSACMKKDIPTAVILPKGYTTDPLKRYPVVYLLHGASDSERHAAHPIFRAAADLNQVIVVCPRGTRTWWLDSPVDPSYKYETFVVRELVPWIDAHYRTVPDRRHRGLTGNSMGGHGSFYIALRHKDRFGAVGSIFGGVDLWPFRDSGKWELRERLGDPLSHPEYWNEHSVVNLARTLKNGELEIMITVGTEDIFIAPNRDLHALLCKTAVDHCYIEKPGAHTQPFWEEAYPQMFRFLSDYFSAACSARPK